MYFGGDPFEHFAHAGMGAGRGARGEVDNEEFYKILGVAKDASDADIKKVSQAASAGASPGFHVNGAACGLRSGPVDRDVGIGV
jgi:hypothetical protein